MVSIILPSQILIIVCGTADGRLYRVDCVAHAAQNKTLSVTPLQQAEVEYIFYCLHNCASLLCAVKWQTISQAGSQTLL